MPTYNKKFYNTWKEFCIMAWTEEMVEELKRLWDEGVTTGEIGRRLNISKNSIVGKVHRLGLSGRPSPIKKKSETKPAEKDISAPSSKKKSVSNPSDKKEEKTEKTSSTVKKTTISQSTLAKRQSTSIPKAAILQPNNEEDIKLAKSISIQNSSQSKKEFLSLTDLDNHTCRWPIGDPKDDNFHFCGKKVRLGQTYCEEHASIAYVKPSKK